MLTTIESRCNLLINSCCKCRNVRQKEICIICFSFNDAVASNDMMISKRLTQTDKEERCRILMFMYNQNFLGVTGRNREKLRITTSLRVQLLARDCRACQEIPFVPILPGHYTAQLLLT
jgi:hypothetical protein